MYICIYKYLDMSKDKIYTLEELQKKLTEKERIFCHEYIIDWNGARSARKAGYTEKADRQAAYDTLTKTYIQQYIEFIKNDIEKEAGISKLKIINKLVEILEGEDEQANNKISAAKEIKKAMGYDEAEKIDHTLKEVKQVFKIGNQEIEF